ncbi:MAG: RagB/SusD family nutrient uptake outer membrane protein [Mangrovibacterium sp.]
MKYIKILIVIISVGFVTGCGDYLDIVPDNVATMDNAFSNRIAAEKFLFTCYSYLPNPVNVWNYPAQIGGDEIWWNIDQGTFKNNVAIKIAQGQQNANDPYHNFWDGRNGGTNLFIAIRDCNIFLENINKPQDLEEAERILWTAEVKFLKAYYHFFLMQLYGPIPVIRENIPVSAGPEEVRVYREPIDDVVDYIVQLLDEAAKDLPLEIYNKVSEAGRITQPIALAVKAKVLVWAASPLLNGNPDYVYFKDNRGRQLIPSDPDPSKWVKAAEAIKAAIDTCHLANHKLYEYVPDRTMSDLTKLKYIIRGVVTDKFNSEIVWPATQDVSQMQKWYCPTFVSTTTEQNIEEIGSTLKIAEQYYTSNGIPIDEDPSWDYSARYETQVAGADHEYYVKIGETTAKLNFNREPRFYGSLGFDRGIFEGAGQPEASSYYLQARKSESSGFRAIGNHFPSGYFIKKLVSVETVNGAGATYKGFRYSYPLIRLADLYLLYAEALNETKESPDAEVYYWIDLVRKRAGLKGVLESWEQSSIPNKPATREGMRNIIKRERLIELAFEGQRFFDLRRWKDALRYLNEPVQGWDYKGETADTYYQVVTYWNQRIFNTREYLWPLRLNTVIVNSNLVQNPGWK